MNERILAVIVTLLLVAPLVLPVALSNATGLPAVSGQVNLGNNTSVLDLAITGNLTRATGVTGLLDLNLTGSASQGVLAANGKAVFNITTSDTPDSYLESTGTLTLKVTNGSYTSDGNINIHGDLTEEFDYLTGNSSLPIILDFNYTYKVNGVTNGTEIHEDSTGSGTFRLTNGAHLIYQFAQGDIAGSISHAYTAVTAGKTTVVDGSLNVTFASGNQQLDAIIAGYFLQFLSVYISYLGGNTMVTPKLWGTTVVVTFHSVSEAGLGWRFHLIPQLPGGNFSPSIPGVDVGNGIVEGFMNSTGMNPFLYENVTGQASYKVSLTGYEAESTTSLVGEFSATLSGVNLSSLPFYPTNASLTGRFNGGDDNVMLHVEGVGDPSVPFTAVKVLLINLEGLCGRLVTVNVAMKTDSSLHFYDSKTGEDLGDNFTVTCNNLEKLKHVVVLPRGVSVKMTGSDEVEVEGQGEVKIGFSAITSASVVKVNANKIEVNTGLVVISTPKAFHLVATGGKQVIVKLEGGTLIKSKLAMESIDPNAAGSIAASKGYRAAGYGVVVNGVEKGPVIIELPLTASGAQIAVLEVSADGSTKLITNVTVTSNNTVVFTTSSFSTFIPVTLSVTTTTTPPPTTTTTRTTPPPTTTTTQSTTTTTSTPAGTTTTTQSTTTTTIATTTPPATTTTSETGTGAPSAGNTALVVGVIVIVLVVLVAAYYLIRR